MAIAQALTDALTALQAEVTALQGRIGGAATPAEQAQVASQVQAAADALKVIGV